MKTLATLLFSLTICLSAFSQSDGCKKYKRLVQRNLDEFTNTMIYTNANSPIKVIEKGDSVTIIWTILADTQTERTYKGVSVLIDGVVYDIPNNKIEYKYYQVKGVSFGSIYGGSFSFIGTTTKSEVNNRCEMTIRDEECVMIMDKVIKSRKTKVRLWSEADSDFTLSVNHKKAMKNLIALYRCIKGEK